MERFKALCGLIAAISMATVLTGCQPSSMRGSEAASSPASIQRTGNGVSVRLNPNQPGQGISPESVAADPSLWPPRVTVLQTMTAPNGAAAQAGAEYDVLKVVPRSVAVIIPGQAGGFMLPVEATDLLQRSSQLAATPADQRPNRVADALAGHTVDAKGTPSRVDARDAKYVVLYYGASWCGPCREFSPKLVQLHDEMAARHPEVCWVMLSDERAAPDADATMLQYMADEKMNWDAVPPSAKAACRGLWVYEGPTIPSLVVLDHSGKIVAGDVRGGNQEPPEWVLRDLRNLLAGKPG